MKGEVSPRGALFLFLAVAAVAQLWQIESCGWNPAWQRWHIDARTPAFSDLRAITGAGDSIDRGFDPRENNPGAPFGQRFNQTRFWLWLHPLGIREAHSTAIGLVLLGAYAVGLWWLCAGIDRTAAVLLASLILSPAALLAVERGTTDLSVFFLLALACHLAAKAMRSSLVLTGVAFLLKLFPLAGIVLTWREPKPRAIRLTLIVLTVAALFCVVTFRELVDIGYKTEKGPHTSYGWAVLSLHLSGLGGAWKAHASGIRMACGALALIGAWIAVRRGLRWADRPAPSRSLDFFRVGSAVYAGTFALGASWDYRLIFALLMVPQLVRWCSEPLSARWSARSSIAALLVAMWALALKGALPSSGLAQNSARALEELAKVWLFFVSLYLLARSAPEWLRDYVPGTQVTARRAKSARA